MTTPIIAGHYDLLGQKDIVVEDGVFFYDGKRMDKKDLVDWAIWLNSPWSQTCERYVIEINCKDGYTAVEDRNFLWKCTYTIIGYEGYSASIIGYGQDEAEALRLCKTNFESLQDLFNPEREST